MNTLLSSPRRLVVALVAAGALGATGAGLITAREVRAQAGIPAAAAPAPLSASVALPDFSQITARYGAAVVNISVSGMRKASDAEDDDGPAAQPPRGIDPEDPFYEFFRRFGMPGMGAPGGRVVPMRG